MFVRREDCLVCGEEIDWRNTRDYVADRPVGLDQSREVWHFRCVPVNEVVSGEITIAEGLDRYNLWRLHQLAEENVVLRERTDALMREMERRMRADGATDQEIEDFQFEYSFREPVGGS